jgi:hypothetical protein
MKKLRLSTIATFLCLLCMSMGFPNLVEEEKEKDQCKKQAHSTDVRTAALGCSRQISLAEKEMKPELVMPAGATCSVKVSCESPVKI